MLLVVFRPTDSEAVKKGCKMNLFKIPFDLIQKILYALYELYKLITSAKREVKDETQTDVQK